MNYPQSQQILDEIKKVTTILLNCHRGPDPDDIGSVLAMKAALEQMNKKVEIICPSAVISKQTDFLRDYNSIKPRVDFDNFQFDKYDLLVSLDTPNLELMNGKDSSKAPQIKTIIIDHHFISLIKGDLELRDKTATSVGEILYKVFEDWNIEMDKNIAECLVTAIFGDTGALLYPGTTSQTLRIVANLTDKGVDKDMIAGRLYRDEEFQMIKFWSEVLARMEIDREHHFVYSMIPYGVWQKYNNLDDAKAKSASLFGPIVSGTDFGFVGVEEKPEYVTISFRGRTDFDTSQIAKELGGGGHKISSATKIEGMKFDDMLKKVLEVARKYAKKD